MIAKVKCSNCGAELSNFNLSWGKKQFLFVVPIMILAFLPIVKMTFFKGDASKELTISDVQKRVNDQSMEIIGLITNTGSHKWSSVTVEAEFYDSSGAFIDEAQESLRSEVSAKAKEHFKMTIHHPSPAVSGPDTKMVLKISSGMTLPF
jgi:hypothetical protein